MRILHRQLDFPMVLWGLSLLLILGAIAGGLMITGGPAHQRALKMDRNRFSDLARIQSELAEYIDEHGQLPDTLAFLGDLEDDDLLDPVTREAYKYRKISKNAFDLCVTFQADTTLENDMERYYYDSDSQAVDRQHEAGHHCYTLQATREGGASPNGKFRIRKR